MKSKKGDMMKNLMVVVLIASLAFAGTTEQEEIGRNGQFIAYNDGTVLDTKTGMMWAANDNGKDVDWHDAKKYCETFRGGGYDDWRMPTLDELYALYEAGTESDKNFIRISASVVWASETKGSSAAYVSFLTGAKNFVYQSYSGHLRALPVRVGG